MSGGHMNGLLAGASGWLANDETISYPQADADLAYNGGDVLDNHHVHGQGPSGNLSPQRSSRNDPSAYQTEMARADPHRFSYLTVSRDAFSMLGNSLDPNAFESPHYGGSDFDRSFGQVMPEPTALGGRGTIDTRHLDQYMPHVASAHQLMQGVMSQGSLPPAQHHGHGQPGRSTADASFLYPGTAIQQSQAVHGALESPQLDATHVTRIPDRGSDVSDTRATPLDQLSSVQSQDAATSSVKSLICPNCEHQSRNWSAHRHHLDIHKPEKTSKNKCKHCAYTSRYKKDVRRHNLTHEKPGTPQYVCNQPGCNSKFARNDNLLRHGRLTHRGSTSTPSTGTMIDSHLVNHEYPPMDTHLLVPGPMGHPPATLLESFDSISNHSAAGASLNKSSFVVDRTPSFSTPQTAGSSFNGYLDPLLMSPESASDSFCFSGTESPCPQ